MRYFGRMERVGGAMVFKHPPHLDEIFQRVRVRTNAGGWRGPELSEKKERRRILLLGDSITFGWGVAEEQTFARRLEQRLGAEVINLGVGGYNTAMEKAALEKYGLGYSPDAIVLVYVFNDLHRFDDRDELELEWEAAHPPSFPWLARWWKSAVLASATLTRIEFVRRGNAAAERGERIRERWGGVESWFERHPGWKSSRTALAEIAAIARAHDLPFMLYFYCFTDPFFTAELWPRVKEVAAEHNFPAVNLSDEIVLEGSILEWINSAADIHPNARLHEAIAGVLERGLR
jgi:lysophospholipase L1-like esterase